MTSVNMFDIIRGESSKIFCLIQTYFCVFMCKAEMSEIGNDGVIELTQLLHRAWKF